MLRTAVDTSVLLDVFSSSSHVRAAADALTQCCEQGIVLACGVVWAELFPHFSSRDKLMDACLMIGLQFEPLNLNAALFAGKIWQEYRSRGGKRDKLIPDFLIASHALLQADRLLTRDRGFYRRYFSSLKLLQPAGFNS